MGVVRLIVQQLEAGGQFVAAHRGEVLDAPFLVAEGGGLVKSQVVHRDHLGSGAQRDAVPAQQAGDLQVARVVQQDHQDEGGGGKGHDHHPRAELSWQLVYHQTANLPTGDNPPGHGGERPARAGD